MYECNISICIQSKKGTYYVPGLDSLIYLDLVTAIFTLALSIAVGQLCLPRTWSSKCTVIDQLYIKMFIWHVLKISRHTVDNAICR